jgi:hypothetical protein
MVPDPSPEIYQVHVWIRQISPMIWRRLLVHADNTLADLHYAIQIAFGWTDFGSSSIASCSTTRFHERGSVTRCSNSAAPRRIVS